MKLMINYDLIDKIREAKTGFSLQRTVKPILIRGWVATTFIMIINSFWVPPEKMLKALFEAMSISLNIQLLVYIPADLILSKYIRNSSKKSLTDLAMQLRQLNANTDKDLILNSYKYKTEYKLLKNDDSTDLVQKKYIMVPVIENGKENEVSILQEHILGSKIYSLSIGEPTKQKVFKLGLNTM
ncbi:MAG: hypothetical protein IJE04_02870 [Bacilli bacterium]|nr:hypothetical protein [Bacilli bacterium]